jgi:hypothetical protein
MSNLIYIELLILGPAKEDSRKLMHPAIRLSLATNIFTTINCIYTIMPSLHFVFHPISSHRLIFLSRIGLGLQMSSLHISINLYTARKLVLVIFLLSHYGMMIFIVLSIRLFSLTYKSQIFTSSHAISPVYSNRYRETIPSACNFFYIC